MPSEDETDRPQRKRRTREHVIEDLSENHLERTVLLRGHILRRPERDYGVDVTMFHFDENGEIENGEIRFQLKATEKLKVIKRGTTITFPIKTGDLHYWSKEIYPFILVVFDATNDKAFWLDVQKFVSENPGVCGPEKNSVHVHIPVSNSLTESSIDVFRQISLEKIETLTNQGGLTNVRRKPR